MENNSEILEKAKWCLNCKAPKCQNDGCPMKTPIPLFIQYVKEEKYLEAYKVLKENNICSYICSIVCPQENQCEGSCIRGIKQVPTKIGELEKFVNDWAIENNIDYEYKVNSKIGKKVAIIGAGPAGIECAKELLMAGIDVDIYEKEKVFGGILTYGIPDFRLDKKYVIKIEQELINLGAKIYFGKALGKDLNIEELSKKYDAVFLGIGAEISSTYNLSKDKNNNEIENVFNSNVFLKKYFEKNFIQNLGKVVVIGGGNVAMDCSRVAVKMGAKEVKILYRRDRAHMPAREVELDDAIEDGVIFKELTRVDSVNLDENGRIESVNCVRTEIVDGRAKDKNPIESFIEEANTVVFAIGLKPNQNLISSQGFKLNEWGYIDLDENGKTSFSNVYAGGDIWESKATVCRALAAGKKSALKIIEELNK